MTRADSSAFADKHPAGSTIDPAIQRRIREESRNRRLGCAAAHRIARELDVPPEQVGITLDLLGYKITRCQLGLFGYRPDPKPVSQAAAVEPEVENELHQVTDGNPISCRKCWEIAAAHKAPRMAIARACNDHDLKIRPCQLGAF